MRILRRKRATPPPAAGGRPPRRSTSTCRPPAYGALVAIAGELDLATVAQVREAFASEAVEQAAAVVVDLTEVSFMDSTGLSALLNLETDLDASRPAAGDRVPGGRGAARARRGRRRRAPAAVPHARRGRGRGQLSRAARALR